MAAVEIRSEGVALFPVHLSLKIIGRQHGIEGRFAGVRQHVDLTLKPGLTGGLDRMTGCAAVAENNDSFSNHTLIRLPSDEGG